MPEAEPVIIRHIYPANVILPNGTEARSALAIVTQQRVYVWAQLGGTVQAVLDEEYVQPDRPLPHVAQLKTAPIVLGVPGGQVMVSAGSGCGCGSPLKSFRPFAVEVSGPTR